ncbi:MAG: tRNA (adenosine(37)-N6)-threonylcarbamoyltransferase complex ATPase subunit type 1 TsaE [Woeseiaceae bacterium]|nr:tRNA (adenosine(37)-N6)-threonylcarbamoyltransferase complex ATPase subunit type 1 TsaE [Woeseiaceae bacterium]
MKIDLADEAASQRFAEALSAALPEDPSGWTVLLEGELGAGKSTLARALIRSMGHEGPVPSPTYTLVEPYELSRCSVYHVDLYRIADEEELRYLGWNELDEGLRLVEWPDRAPSLSAEADLRIELVYAGDGRRATLTALSQRSRALIEQLAA